MSGGGVRGRVHDAVSRWAWQPAYLGSRALRAGMRPAYAAYRDGMRFRAASQGWSEERRSAWVLARLREVVRRAAATTEFYRARFAAAGFDPAADFTFDDYARLPILERHEVHEAGRGMRSSAVDARLVRKDATGGSTGTPTELWTGPEERGWGESASEFFMRRVGLPAGARTAMLWGHHLDPVTRASLKDRVNDWLHNMTWYDCLRLSSDTLGRYHADLQRRRPAGLVAYASALVSLAEFVERSGDEPRYPTRAFVTGAEKLFPHHRALVERVFGRPVHERYGGRDAGLLGFQCDARSRDFTIDWANVIVEPDDWAPAGEPRGIVITKLHADAMPMLRYRIGDMGRFPADARPGWPAYVLHEVVGRDAQRLWLPDGGWFHGLSFPHMLKDFPVRDFQVAQAEDLSIDVRIVPADAFDAGHEAAILRLVRANVPGVEVTLRRVESIPRTRANKWQPVTSAARAPRAMAGA